MKWLALLVLMQWASTIESRVYQKDSDKAELAHVQDFKVLTVRGRRCNWNKWNRVDNVDEVQHGYTCTKKYVASARMPEYLGGEKKKVQVESVMPWCPVSHNTKWGYCNHYEWKVFGDRFVFNSNYTKTSYDLAKSKCLNETYGNDTMELGNFVHNFPYKPTLKEGSHEVLADNWILDNEKSLKNIRKGLKPLAAFPGKYWVAVEGAKNDKCIEYDTVSEKASVQDCNNNNYFVCQSKPVPVEDPEYRSRMASLHYYCDRSDYVEDYAVCDRYEWKVKRNHYVYDRNHTSKSYDQARQTCQNEELSRHIVMPEGREMQIASFGHRFISKDANAVADRWNVDENVLREIREVVRPIEDLPSLYLVESNGLKPTEELPTKYWVFTDKKKTDKCIEYDSMTGTASLQDCNKNNLFVCQLRIKNKQ